LQSDIDGKNHLALSEDGTSGVKLLPLPDMQGSQAVCIMYMDHVGFQARYASFTMICSIWARRPDMQGSQAVSVMYMPHMGSQVRYNSCTMICRVGLGGPGVTRC
jgi:hypothetical protein